MNTWHPTGASYALDRPPAGRLVGVDHAVWEVTAVRDLDLTDADRDLWLSWGMPDLDTWKRRPYRVHLRWAAGVRPADMAEDDDVASMTIRSSHALLYTWYVYPPSGRWPQCSCCGEPMPCRADLQDQEVEAGLAVVEKFATRMPGCCWACNEPIASRQKSVTYAGDNLDLPGAPAPRFHARAGCGHTASKYELRWIAIDPRRERVLTYPKCAGILVVHEDGSSECQSGSGPLGEDHAGEPDCRGHLTHDHGVQMSCYVGGAWMARAADMPGCPRGCDPKRHRGIRTTRRPARRCNDATLPTT